MSERRIVDWMVCEKKSQGGAGDERCRFVTLSRDDEGGGVAEEEATSAASTVRIISSS